MLLPAIIFSFLFFTSEATSFQKCQNLPAPSKVEINLCSGSLCKVLIAQQLEIDVELKSPIHFSTAHPDVGFTVQGYAFNQKVVDYSKNACDWLVGSACPVIKGRDVHYKLVMPVPNFPVSEIDMEIKMVDGKKIPITCFKFKLNVQKNMKE